MTEEFSATSASEAAAVAAVFVEASESPIAGGRWEILEDDTVRYVRPSGEVEMPAMVAASTLRTSPTWRRLT